MGGRGEYALPGLCDRHIGLAKAANERQPKIQPMRPKGKLFALLAVFTAIGLITATGAFTTVTAERTAEVNVAGDDSALLQLDEPAGIDEGAVSESNGVAEIDLTSTNLGASGINPDAVTTLTPLLNVTNQGNDDTTLNVTVSTVTTGGTGVSGANVTAVDSSGTEFSDTSLGTGNTTQFGLKIDLTDIDQSDLNGANELTITIEISAE